jgi:predicted nucleic acid-binding protein
MRDVLLDTNVFILFLAGQINQNRIPEYCREPMYSRKDYYFLVDKIQGFDRIITSPNILTEVDNLLNRLIGADKIQYLELIKNIYAQSLEKYLKSDLIAEQWYFAELGLTDSAILMMAKDCNLLISADSSLCDFARSFGVPLFDFREYLNNQIKNR